MPPAAGRLATRLGEALFGRAAPGRAPQQAGRAGKQHVPHSRPSHQAPHSALHTSAPSHTSASQAVTGGSRAASGKLVNVIVETFAPLWRQVPGGAGASNGIANKHVFEISARFVGRTAAQRAGFHASPSNAFGFSHVRPNASFRPSSTQLGLQTARNFSSSRPVLQNVVQNAPLGLRALGDQDRLDMRALRKEVRAARLREAAQKGKARAFGQAGLYRALDVKVPAGMNAYFPAAPVAATAAAQQVEQPTVQLILPLNPVTETTPFLSYTAHGTAVGFEDSHFFSAMLMSDLRLLSEMHGIHHARMRNTIQRLESAGCFEPDGETGGTGARALLDELGERIVVTFHGDRWRLADVKQVLGQYEGQGQTWYQLVDLAPALSSPPGDSCELDILHDGEDEDMSDSQVPSSLPSSLGDAEQLGIASGYTATPLLLSSRTSRRTSLSGSTSEADGPGLADSSELETRSCSLVLPSFESISGATRDDDATLHPSSAHSASMSYVWGVEQFLDGLESSKRPTFF